LKIEINPSVFLTYKARDIQTRLDEHPTCIDVNESSKSAAQRLDKFSYEQAPVTENGQVVGWILRSTIDSSSESKVNFDLLDQADLISADAPLNDLLQRLMRQKLIFLVGATGIEGFAVQSDIERHVSRAHLYLLISGLEICMAKILNTNLSDPAVVIPKMSSQSKYYWDIAKANDEDANPIEYLDLNGLGESLILEKEALIHLGLTADRFKIYLGMLKNIRDWVAHSNTQEMRRQPFGVVVEQMIQTENYIKKLIKY
jgi:hypothetical protein